MIHRPVVYKGLCQHAIALGVEVDPPRSVALGPVIQNLTGLVFNLEWLSDRT